MKNILASLQFIIAVTLLALAAGCASTKHTEQMLSAAGSKAVVPSTVRQEQQIKTLRADKLTVAHRSGKTYYVFPDPAHNRLYVGNPQQYQNYQQMLANNKIAVQNRVDATWRGRTEMMRQTGGRCGPAIRAGSPGVITKPTPLNYAVT
jgi:hypothetical protein